MRESHEFLPMAVFAADSEGRLRYRLPLVTYTNAIDDEALTLWMSPQVEAVTGYRPSEWIGRRGFFEGTVLHPDDRAWVVEQMRASRLALTPFSSDYRMVSRDGETRWVHDESVPVLDSTGRAEFIQGYFFDVTERKQLEESHRQSQKTEALGRAAAAVAHDFNNVLTAVIGYIDLAEKQLDAGEEVQARKRLVGARGAIERGARLTHRLVAFSRRQDPQPGRVDLVELVRGMEDLLEHVAGPTAPIEVSLPVDVCVLADLGQIEHVLVNLVTNARDAMCGGGTILVAVTLIDLDRGEDTDRLGIPPGQYGAIAVSDHGAGMDDETRGRIFEAFFTTKPRGEGTGLGLATAHGVVRASGGAIDVDSTPGQGSTFTVLLPLAPAQPA